MYGRTKNLVSDAKKSILDLGVFNYSGEKCGKGDVSWNDDNDDGDDDA